MGARGNVYITSSATEGAQARDFAGGARGIYVYAHWDGYALPAMTQRALRAGRGRWSDDQYLTRILIDQLTASGRDEETGFGVGLSIGDNEYPITVVDLGRQTVAWANQGSERDPANWRRVTPFAKFVEQDEADYPLGLRT